MGLLEPGSRPQLGKSESPSIISRMDTVQITPIEWRTACFEELGFTAIEARLLAEVEEQTTVKTKTGQKTYKAPLHHLKIRKMLDRGASHAQVLDLMLPL